MKKLMSILFTITFISGAMAQDVSVQRINNIDPNKEYDSYAFLDSNQPMNQRGQNTSYDNQNNADRQVGMQTREDANKRQNDTQLSSTERRDQNREAQSARNGQSLQEWSTLNPIENVIIKEAITYQFDVEGLKMKKDDPDVYIQYHIYEEEYNDDASYAVPADEGMNTAGISDDDNTYRQKQNMMNRIEDGTVVMSVVDADDGRSVWEGFAFNSFKDDASVREKQIGLRQAVDALVTQFLADNENMAGAHGVTR